MAGKLCPDNWGRVLDDPTPRAIRWATRKVWQANDWSKWHYSEGNFAFTACGRVIVPFMVDDSPQEAELQRINCKRCLAKMKDTDRD